MSPLKEHALGVLVVCLALGACLGPCAPPAQCVCVFPGRVWLPGRVVAHRGPPLLPQPKPSFEQSKKETQRAAAPTAPTEGPPGRQEQEAEKQAALNKGTVLALQVLLQQAPHACPGHGEIPAQRSPALPQHHTWLGPCPPSPGMLRLVFLCPAVGIVPPRTKSPPEEEVVPAGSMLRRSAGGMANGLGSKARPTARGWGWMGRAGLAGGGSSAAVMLLCSPVPWGEGGGNSRCVVLHLSTQLGTSRALRVPLFAPGEGSPLQRDAARADGVGARSVQGYLTTGLGSPQERPKSAVFANETKVKMSVEEQIDRMKRHQSGSMKEKRRSLQLLGSQQPDTPGMKAPASYKVVSPCTSTSPPAQPGFASQGCSELPEGGEGAEGTPGAVAGDSLLVQGAQRGWGPS